MRDIKEFRKYPKINGIAIVPEILAFDGSLLFEKIDGGNTQVRKTDGRVICASRATILNDKTARKRWWFSDFLHWTMANHSFYNLPKNVIIYGEWLAFHSLPYRNEVHDKFYLLDILDLDSERFIDYRKAVELTEKWGLEDIQTLKVLQEGKVCIADLIKATEKSDYRDGRAEGIVVKNYPHQSFAKVLAPRKSGNQLELSEIVRVVNSILDSDIELNVENVTLELSEDLREQGVTFPRGDLKSEVVNKYDAALALMRERTRMRIY